VLGYPLSTAVPITTVQRRVVRTRPQPTRRAIAFALLALTLIATVLAPVSTTRPAAALTPTSGYWMLDGSGRLYEFGAAEPHPAVT